MKHFSRLLVRRELIRHDMNMTQTRLSGLDIAFPLTLALSLGEREPAASRSDLPTARPASPVAGLSLRRQTILPLPQGEGRGEGEGRAYLTQPAVIPLAARN